MSPQFALTALAKPYHRHSRDRFEAGERRPQTRRWYAAMAHRLAHTASLYAQLGVRGGYVARLHYSAAEHCRRMADKAWMSEQSQRLADALEAS